MPFYDGHDGTADSALVSSEGPSITVIPAYDSKDKPVVYIPIRVGRDASVIVEIQQTDQFHGTTGSTLWLGGQASFVLFTICRKSEWLICAICTRQHD